MLHLLVTEIDRFQTLVHKPKKVAVQAATGEKLTQETCRLALVAFFTEPDFQCEPFQIGADETIAYLWDEERDYQIILLSEE